MSSTVTHRKTTNGHANGHSTTNGHSTASTSSSNSSSSSSEQQSAGRLGYAAFGVVGSHVTWKWWVLTVSGLVVVPFLVYWCWICLEYNQGSMILPYYTTVHLASDPLHNLAHPIATLTSRTFTLSSWWQYVSDKILTNAIPTWQAWRIYLTWTLFQAILFKVGPGHQQKGVRVASGARLTYTFNGQFAFFTTLITAFYLHFSGLFSLTILYDLFPQMLSVCIIWCSIVIGAIYLVARAKGTIENQTDSILYDYFMGPQLNPHILPNTVFSFDIKCQPPHTSSRLPSRCLPSPCLTHPRPSRCGYV